MSNVLEIACLLGDGPPGDRVDLLTRLAALLDDQAAADAQSAADELDTVLFDLAPALLGCAALSPAAERQVRRVLAAAAQHCTAREVFTLGMAALGEQLSAYDTSAPPPTCGPASPSFQLFLLRTLCSCLPRIRRRALHFAAELLHMQLRWAAEVLPGLPLGDAQAAASAVASSDRAAVAASEGDAAGGAPPTLAGAVAGLAQLAAQMAGWLQQQPASEAGQLTDSEQQTAAALLSMTLLQLASLTLQLPSALQAAEAAVAAVAQARPGSASSIGAAPTAGGRLPVMRAAAEQLLLLPRVLLRQVPASTFGSGSSDSSSSGERLQQLAAAGYSHLASSGLDPEELSYFSAAEAEEGAAAAVCAEALDTATSPQQQAAALQQALPHAARQLLDLGAQHQSVALSLLPLGALCTVCGAVSADAGDTSDGSGGPDHPLAASTPALAALLSALVAIMSHNPVQLVRSCAHDALQALLDAFQPAARLEQLRALMQMPSTAAAVVTLQRLRQEMAAAWQGAAARQGQQALAATSGSSSVGASCSQLWVSEAALGLALPCLEQGTEAGWHDEASVLQHADVQAAALSLLRWVLLREAAAPRGLLPHPAAERLLRRDLLPLQACVLRLLSAQSSAMAAGGSSGGEGGPSASGSGVAAALEQQQQLDSYLAVQRLHEALSCVIELIEAPPGGGGN